MAEHTLDVRGLMCPLPVLRANKVLRGLATGDRLTVLATDPAAPKDFEAFCDTTRNALEEQRVDDGVFVMVVRKTA